MQTTYKNKSSRAFTTILSMDKTKSKVESCEPHHVNLSSEIFDHVRFKPACSATETS